MTEISTTTTNGTGTKPGACFSTKAGVPVSGVTASDFTRAYQRLLSEFHLTPAQVVEAASYSMAMVVRFALGLSATGGKVMAMADDCLAGWVTLAALRHLENAGATTVAVVATDSSELSEEISLQLTQLEAVAIPICTLDDILGGSAQDMVEQCHNLLCGIVRPDGACMSRTGQLCTILNEAKTPVHTVMAPPGINPDNGQPNGSTLFASSTLSLGMPLAGLRAAHDFVGRHYLCDISFPRAVYEEVCAAPLGMLFEEQPVVQIFSLPVSAAKP